MTREIEGRSAFYTRIGTSSSAILGGLLGLLLLRLPFDVNTITGLLMLPFALSFLEPKREKMDSPEPMKSNLKILIFRLKHSQLRFYMLYGP